VVMFVQMIVLIGVKSRSVTPLPADNAAAVAADTSNLTWLAHTLFTQFLLPFEFAAVILTVAVIAAVMLTLRKRTGTKTQDPSAQTRVKARDRVRIVKMASEKPAAPAAAGSGEPGSTQEANS